MLARPNWRWVEMVRIRALVRHDLRLFLRDPVFLVLMIVMPIAVMGFLKGTFKTSLRAEGFADASGAEQVVPGAILMFSTFLLSNLSFSIFRDHGARTWDRVRVSPASTGQILLGKSVVPFGLLGVQFTALLLVGVVAFGLEIRGPVLALIGVALAYWLCLLAFGFLLIALCHTFQQVNAFAQLGAIVFAGLGGALTAMSQLPGWAQAIAPITPHYWAMRGFRSVILEGKGIDGVLLPIAVLIGVAVVIAIVALRLFDPEAEKLSWA